MMVWRVSLNPPLAMPGGAEPDYSQHDHAPESRLTQPVLACQENLRGPAREVLRILSEDEQKRAARFRFQEHRDAFLITRGSLRNILGTCLGVPPASLTFAYCPQGKPRLSSIDKAAPDSPPLRFNLTHTSGMALIAVAWDRELGIDIEYIGRRISDDQIPESFFSAREVADLRALPEHQQRLAFFRCWSRKEAFIKAKGGGLSIPLDQFDVTLGPHEQTELRAVRWDAAEAKRWRLENLDPEPFRENKRYVGALAVEGRDWDLQHRVWPV